MRLNRLLLGMLGLCAIVSLAQDMQRTHKLPLVTSGDMQFYPSLARIAQLEGDVNLRVTTDGSQVAAVAVESGPAMLAKAAQDNVKTWKFEPHVPTTFSTVFSYRLVKELITNSCDPDVPDNGTVTLTLPSRVEITSHLRIRDCHDPNEGLDLSEPLRVFLTACDVDGTLIPCEKLNIRLHSGSLTATPARFKESEKKQGFLVPKEFRSLKTFGVSVDTGKESFRSLDVDIDLLRGDWRIGIDHAPFRENSPVYYDTLKAPSVVRCVGFIVFEGEPGVVTWIRCN